MLQICSTEITNTDIFSSNKLWEYYTVYTFLCLRFTENNQDY